MKHGLPWRITGMAACFALGAGISMLWSRDRDERPEPDPASATQLDDLASSASRNRTLHLEHLWSQCRTIPDAAEAGPRVIAALYSGKVDETAMKEAIALLIRDPSFINRIWEQGDPAKRTELVNLLFKELADADPDAVLDLIDAATFDLSGLDALGYLMWGLPYLGNDPVRHLETAKRNRDKMGKKHFDRAIQGATRRAESSLILLTEAAMGADYPEKDLIAACSAVMHRDGALPPGTSHLEAAKKYFARKEAKEGIAQWLDGTKELTASELKEFVASDSGVIFDSLWSDSKTIDARKLDLLAQAGLIDEQKQMLSWMVGGGRTQEIIQALDGLKDMPASQPVHGELIAAVATAIYEYGGDVGEASRLMAGISDDPTYWKSMEEVLKMC